MTLVGCGPRALWQPAGGATNASQHLIDAASEISGAIIPISKTGNIAFVHWRTHVVTLGATVDVRVETIDASGQPSGTLWAANTNGAQIVADADDGVWFRTALTAAAAVTQGDFVAVIIANPAAAFGTINIAAGQLGTEGIATGSNVGLPYGVSPTRTTKTSAGTFVILEYNDGTFCLPGNYVPWTRTAIALNTGTNPDELANYFIPDVPCRVVGWGSALQLAAGADYRIALYQAGNNTPLATTPTIDGDLTSLAASFRPHSGFFTANTTLVVGTTYRIALVPLTVNSVTMAYFDFPATAGMRELWSPFDLQYSSRNRAGISDPDSAAWTENTARVLLLWPLIDQVDNGAGAGGGLARIFGG